ncbi:MAG: hypothetical protein ACE5J7_01105 [Candidatus Aenigmatarchaeota archaeon]
MVRKIKKSSVEKLRGLMQEYRPFREHYKETVEKAPLKDLVDLARNEVKMRKRQFVNGCSGHNYFLDYLKISNIYSHALNLAERARLLKYSPMYKKDTIEGAKWSSENEERSKMLTRI